VYIAVLFTSSQNCRKK